MSRCEARCFDARGHIVWSQVSLAAVRVDGDGALHLIAQIEDISEHKRNDEDLRRQAEFDPLTGVFNRRRFEDEMARHRALAARFGHWSAVIVVDVDGLKEVNDKDGHQRWSRDGSPQYAGPGDADVRRGRC